MTLRRTTTRHSTAMDAAGSSSGRSATAVRVRVKHRNRPMDEGGIRFLSLLRNAMVFAIAYLVFVGVGIAWVDLLDHVDRKGYLALEKLDIEGLGHTTQQQVIMAADLNGFAGRRINLMRLNLRSISERIAELPWVARVTLDRDLPHRLVIQVEEQKPVALGQFKDSGFWLINNLGVAFKKAEGEEGRGLVVFNGLDPEDLKDAVVGESSRLAYLLRFYSRYQESPLPSVLKMSDVSLKDDSINAGMYPPAGPRVEVVFGRHGFEKKMARVAKVYPEALKANKEPVWIFANNRRKPNWVTVRYDGNET